MKNRATLHRPFDMMLENAVCNDLDGNNIDTFVSGGKDDSYGRWIHTKKIKTKGMNGSKYK